uniref:Uncharacterized protein n=1 Tax=Knipowitschia caucasica TaxID=637954 RepID=A0AAV2JAB9_KNICA
MAPRSPEWPQVKVLQDSLHMYLEVGAGWGRGLGGVQAAAAAAGGGGGSSLSSLICQCPLKVKRGRLPDRGLSSCCAPLPTPVRARLVQTRSGQASQNRTLKRRPTEELSDTF